MEENHQKTSEATSTASSEVAGVATTAEAKFLESLTKLITEHAGSSM